MDRLEERGGQPAGGCSDDAKSDVSADFVAQRSEIVLDRTEFADHPTGPVGDDHTFRCEFTAGPIDQCRAELLFEASDVGGDVRLDSVEGSGSSGERVVFGNGKQCVKLTQIHR